MSGGPEVPPRLGPPLQYASGAGIHIEQERCSYFRSVTGRASNEDSHFSTGLKRQSAPDLHKISVQNSLPASFQSAQLKSGKRLIVIDGSNVAMGHGNHEFFSWPGIDICVRLFVERGHPEVVAFVPSSRKEWQKSSPDPVRDQKIIEKLTRANHLKFTPARKFLRGDGSHAREISYDDPIILSVACDHDGVVISNDFFRDLINVDPRFRKVIEERVIGFTFYKNTLCIPSDVHGRRSGMTVEQLLDRNATSRPPGTPAYPISITVDEHSVQEATTPYRVFSEAARRQEAFRGIPSRDATQFFPQCAPVLGASQTGSCHFSSSSVLMTATPSAVLSLDLVDRGGTSLVKPSSPASVKGSRKRKRKGKKTKSDAGEPTVVSRVAYQQVLASLSAEGADGEAQFLSKELTKRERDDRRKIQKMRDKLYSFLSEETTILPPMTMCVAGRPGEPLRFLCLLCVKSFPRESHLEGHLGTRTHYVNLMIRDQTLREFRSERYEMLRKGDRRKNRWDSATAQETVEELLGGLLNKKNE